MRFADKIPSSRHQFQENFIFKKKHFHVGQFDEAGQIYGLAPPETFFSRIRLYSE